MTTRPVPDQARAGVAVRRCFVCFEWRLTLVTANGVVLVCGPCFVRMKARL